MISLPPEFTSLCHFSRYRAGRLAWGGNKHAEERNHEAPCGLCVSLFHVEFDDYFSSSSCFFRICHVELGFRSFRRSIGKDLDGLGFKELQQMESQLTEGLLSVKQKKVIRLNCNFVDFIIYDCNKLFRLRLWTRSIAFSLHRRHSCWTSSLNRD